MSMTLKVVRTYQLPERRQIGPRFLDDFADEGKVIGLIIEKTNNYCKRGWWIFLVMTKILSQR